MYKGSSESSAAEGRGIGAGVDRFEQGGGWGRVSIEFVVLGLTSRVGDVVDPDEV